MEWYLTIQTASAMELKLFTGYDITNYLFNKLLRILLKILFFSFFVPIVFFWEQFSFIVTHDSNEAQKWCLMPPFLFDFMIFYKCSQLES